MGRMTQRRRITRLHRDTAPARSPQGPAVEAHDEPQVHMRGKVDTLAAEEPMELRLGGESFTVTMRTPGNDFELAAGFLVGEGIIGTPEELRGLRYCAGTDEHGNQTYNVVDAELDPLLVRPPVSEKRNVLTTSACGICGTTSIDAVEKTLPQPQDTHPQLHMTAQTLLELPDTLRDSQKIFDKTGGVHAAGLFNSAGELICLREDVGRHNAVDKVIGWALMQGHLPLAGTALQVSGRASFELVQKAALAGIEMLSAVGAPSSLAADLSDRAGLTLAGFSRGRSANLYTHQHRISEAETPQPSQHARASNAG